MRLWRLVVDLNPGVWTVITAAKDHQEAWQVTLARLPSWLRQDATLEELEGTYSPARGAPRVVKHWRLRDRRESPPAA